MTSCLIHSLSFLRWPARGTCTSLSATPRPFSPWFFLTIRGPTWRRTGTAWPVWTRTPYRSLTTMTQLPTSWRPQSTASLACPSQTSTTFNEARKPICKKKQKISICTPHHESQSRNSICRIVGWNHRLLCSLSGILPCINQEAQSDQLPRVDRGRDGSCAVKDE